MAKSKGKFSLRSNTKQAVLALILIYIPLLILTTILVLNWIEIKSKERLIGSKLKILLDRRDIDSNRNNLLPSLQRALEAEEVVLFDKNCKSFLSTNMIMANALDCTSLDESYTKIDIENNYKISTIAYIPLEGIRIEIAKHTSLIVPIALINILFIWLSLSYLLSRSILAPITEINDTLKSANEYDFSEKIMDLPLPIELNALKKTIIDLLLKVKDKEIANERYKIARQVAHDIRSPLEALKASVSQRNQSSSSNNTIIKLSLDRINEIANNLLDENQETASLDQALIPIIEQIINEKNINSQNRISIAPFDPSIKEILIFANASDLKRVISNLINNSIDASQPGSPISVLLKQEFDKIIIEIEDNGKGIPENILENIFKDPKSFGKINGHGIGLISAKEIIEKFNGSLHIKSKLGFGTTVSIILPISKSLNSKFVFLDNDELMRITWASKALEKKVDLQTYASFEELSDFLSNYSFETTFYIDSELESELKGEEIAKQLYDKGFRELFLCTGYSPNDFKDMYWLKGIVGKKVPF